MLLQFENVKQNQTLNPHGVFAHALQAYPQQVYQRPVTDVNKVIHTHPDLYDFRDRLVTGTQMWTGEKLKGRFPHIFTIPIVAAVVIPGSERTTSYGETYERLSIQPSWMTRKLVIVKEEVHADDVQRKMIFLGRNFEMGEAKKLLIPALLQEMRLGSQKALKSVPEAIELDKMTTYLEEHFEALFGHEKPALFHVVHGVIGEEEQPHELWQLVRLAENEPMDEGIRERVTTSVSTKLYQETMKHFANKTKDSAKV